MGSADIKSMKAALDGRRFDSEFKQFGEQLKSLVENRASFSVDELSKKVIALNGELNSLRSECFEEFPGPLSVAHEQCDNLMLDLIQIVECEMFLAENRSDSKLPQVEDKFLTAEEIFKSMSAEQKSGFLSDLSSSHGVDSNYFNCALDVIGSEVFSLNEVVSWAMTIQEGMNCDEDVQGIDF